MTSGVAGRSVCLVLGTSEGGVGAHVRTLAGRLCDGGAAVTVCGPTATQAVFDFAAAGARFSPIPITNGVRPVADRQAVSLLRRAAARSDLVHAHGLRAGYVALRAQPTGVPLVVTWHNAVLGSGVRRRLFAAIEKRVARGATLNLAVSSDLVTRIGKLGGQAELAPVGADRDRRVPAPVAATPDASAAPLILAIGRLHPQKGFDVLIEAAAALSGHLARPRFVIAGDGPLRADLQRRIDRTGAPVQLLGRRDDVPDLLTAAALVVMPSRWEGSPLAAHEALLAGRPLIATSVGGLPDLAAGGAIELVPPDDAVALAAAITRLLDDSSYAAALAARGAARALEWPDSIASADAAIACYVQVLSA